MRPRTARASASLRFNSVVGFLASTTRQSWTQTTRRAMFQSRCGFSGFCDSAVNVLAAKPSIEFQSRRGFSGFCDPGVARKSTSAPRFNPVVGFLGSATSPTIRQSVRASKRFNPVVGFLGSATPRYPAPPRTVAPFQSRRGFSGFCDSASSTSSRSRNSVSIPSWVFWVLRHGATSPPGGETSCFNPVVGFLGSATPPEWSAVSSSDCFNPVVGFLGSATRAAQQDGYLRKGFQSRRGFSGFCDSLVTFSISISAYGFNPVVGFLGSATELHS